jgi:hypothetical protein
MSYRPITDVWILARPKVKYYGAYPNGFLERARALLGVTPLDSVLHVCGGCASRYPAKPRGFGPNDKTLDLDGEMVPDYQQSAEEPLPLLVCPDATCLECVDGNWHTGVKGHSWPALIADPPYTEADADHYAPGREQFPSANKILRNMLGVVRPGGRVGMLHYVLPQPPREGVRFVACVGVIVGYNNRMRVFSVFEREVSA